MSCVEIMNIQVYFLAWKLLYLKMEKQGWEFYHVKRE